MAALNVSLNRLTLKNPILVASGTFGYAKEMTAFVDFTQLGGIIPKTVTPQPRPGNPPPRTVETASGMLNSIGLDNDGFDQFVAEKLPYLAELGTSIIVNIAAKANDDFRRMASRLNEVAGVYPKIMLEGAMDAGVWSCGMVAGLIHDVPTVQQLIDRIMREADEIISRRLAGMNQAG